MKSKSIALKSLLCSLLYLIFNLLIIFTQYILNLSVYSALVLGILCGFSIALTSYCYTTKRTICATIAGIVSTVAMELILRISGIPYKILMHIFRNDETIQVIGHLTVNELIGYNWGRLFFFWPGLLTTIIIFSILVPILFREKNRTK